MIEVKETHKILKNVNRELYVQYSVRTGFFVVTDLSLAQFTMLIAMFILDCWALRVESLIV